MEVVETHLPTPYSCVKYKIAKNMIREWGEFWDCSQLESEFFAPFDKNVLIHFLTNRGPFPSYLHRFKKLGSLLCVCVLVGDADHYVFRFPPTAEFHLKEPSDEHRKGWFKNLRYNGQAQYKLIQAFKVSNGICDRLIF
ncbi:hypothetical protein AVEN_142219-1 [Araneus ventricosus]|uniref:Uncharacterized protein n=1 Tax=Araneus ventricosus TaxID=182803 RepID=A0A4Y2KP69_ARAVE|nr:hypothetical protein AVEN_142219-1 [Araneus ventricosus]